MHRYEITADHRGSHLRLYTPTESEVRRHATALARFYNDPHNSAMMDHSSTHTVEDVIEMYAEPSPHMIPFFIEADGLFLGDADLRSIDRHRRTAEYAVMIGERSTQGKGWGTQISLMATHFAFVELKLQTVYLSIIPANVAGRRAYEKVGYVIDNSPEAVEYMDQPGDIVMSVRHETLVERHGERLQSIHIGRLE